MNTVTIEIPWPGKYNDPNSRPPHWSMEARDKALARTAARRACWATGKNGKLWKRARVCVTAYHKTKRFRDPQNIIAMLKATIDGVEDAGVLLDDTGLEWGPVTRLKDKDNPRVVLVFEKAEDKA